MGNTLLIPPHRATCNAVSGLPHVAISSSSEASPACVTSLKNGQLTRQHYPDWIPFRYSCHSSRASSAPTDNLWHSIFPLHVNASSFWFSFFLEHKQGENHTPESKTKQKAINYSWLSEWEMKMQWFFIFHLGALAFPALQLLILRSAIDAGKC